MIVYIFRHGEAETKKDSPDKTDAGRRISAEGRTQVKNVLEIMGKLDQRPAVILSSPLTRARQTADIVKETLNPNADVTIESSLEPDAKVENVYKALSKFKSSDGVILVTHYPILGHLLNDFLNLEDIWENYEMGNGGIARIDFKGLPKSKNGTLKWLLPQINEFREPQS